MAEPDMNYDVRKKEGTNYYVDAYTQSAWFGCQAATAASDAEWRGVVEKLVTRGKAVLEYEFEDEPDALELLSEALAQAEKLMGRK